MTTFATGTGDEVIVWRDELSTPPPPNRPTATDEGGRDEGADNRDEVSLLSWNVLSQTSEQANEPYAYRGMELIPPRPWRRRLPQILDVIRRADADVVCLQEVSTESFRDDVLPSLGEGGDGGYDGLVQEGKGRYPAVATLWKADRLVLDVASYRSRTMTTVLRDARDRLLAVVNCHLEGHPHRSGARVRQLHHALRDASLRHSHHGLIVCGDFNCELHSSACAAYLALGSVPRDAGVSEWSRPVPTDVYDVALHPYDLSSAYPPELGRDRPFEFFTYCRLPGRPAAGLDQVWYTAGPLRRVALRRLFPSEAERRSVLGGGLPSDDWPSDHVPVGCVLLWEPPGGGGERKDLKISSTESNKRSNRTRSDLLAEASELLAACPFNDDEERREFDYVVSEVPGLPEKGKPTPELIAQLADRRKRRDKLLARVSDETRQMLQRVVKLKRDATKAKQ